MLRQFRYIIWRRAGGYFFSEAIRLGEMAARPDSCIKTERQTIRREVETDDERPTPGI